MSLTLPSTFPSLAVSDIARDIHRFCDIGNRFVGSPGEAQARELIEAEFKSAGLDDVRLEEVPIVVYDLKAAECGVPARGMEFPTTGLQFTHDGVAEGPAVFLGAPSGVDELRDAVARVDLSGKLAVIQTYWPYNMCGFLVDEGAIGLIVISTVPTGAIANHTALFDGLPDTPLPVPGVIIDNYAGANLVALLAAEPETVVKVTHRVEYRWETSANVVGEIGGQTQERVVVCAHYDTQRQGVGAQDNSTGLSTLLNMARAWAGTNPTRGITLVGLADEELGSRGAAAYVDRHFAELSDMVAMFNLDALAWALPGKRAMIVHEDIKPFVVARAREIDWEPEVFTPTDVFSGDHSPFDDNGVPACWIWRFPPQHVYYHSSGDVPEFLDMDLVTETANVIAYTALSLARTDESLAEA